MNLVLNTKRGEWPVRARRVSEHFAVHKPLLTDTEVYGSLVLTHIPTGYVTVQRIPDRATATKIARRLEPLLPWAQVKTPADISKFQDRLPSIKALLNEFGL